MRAAPRVWAFALSLTVFVGGLASAHAEAPAPVEPSSAAVELVGTPVAVQQLYGLWSRRREALGDKDPERAKELFDRVVQVRADLGVRRLDGFAFSLLREAHAALAGDDGDLATRRINQAEVLAPGLPEIIDARRAVTMTASPLALHRWVQLKIKAFSLRLADSDRRMLLLSDVALTLFLLTVALGVVFTLTQVLRYGLNIYHDLGEAFPAMLKFVVLALLALLLVVPLVFGFGPLLFFPPVVLLIWGYQRWGERTLSVVFVLMLAGAPWLLRMGDRLSDGGTGVTHAMHAVALNASDVRARARLERWATERPDDWQVAAVLGLAHKRAGDLDRAVTLLTVAVRGAPDAKTKGYIYNNLGNTHFAAGRAKSAGAAYEQAEKLARKSATPLFNHHRLLQRTGAPTLAGEKMRLASKLEPQKVATWAEQTDVGRNRFIVDMDLPGDTLTRRALSGLLTQTPWSRRAWVVLAGPIPEIGAAIIGVVTLALLALLTFVRRRLRLSWPCVRCGRPSLVSMSDGVPQRPQCEQCVNLFVRSIPVDRRIRFDKEQAVARFATVRQLGVRVAGCVLPGLGWSVTGHIFRGMAVTGVALYALLRFWLPSGLLHEPVVPLWGLGVGRWIFAGVAICLWAYGAFRAFKWTPRGH